MNRRFVVVFSLLFVVVSFLAVPLALAVDVSGGEFYADNAPDIWDQIWLDFPSTNATASSYGQIFNCTATDYLKSISLYLVKWGADPKGTVACSVYTVSGGLPSVLLATSAVRQVNLTGTSISDPATAWFQFDFASNVLLTANVSYIWTVQIVSSENLASDNFLGVWGKNGYPLGNTVYYDTSAWHSGTGDLYFNVTLSEGVVSTPVPSGGQWGVDPLIVTFALIIMDFVVALLFSRFAGKVGFFAGLTISVVVGNIVFPVYIPIWIPLAVGIVDFFVLYSALKGVT